MRAATVAEPRAVRPDDRERGDSRHRDPEIDPVA
jgi:hypothetical protein